MEVSTKVGELIQVYDYIGDFGNRHNDDSTPDGGKLNDPTKKAMIA